MNLLRLPEVEPDIEYPFKDDLLDRKELAERLTSFLANVQGPFTMALTSPYGSGKTFFLRRCKLLLEKRHVPIILINAWDTDFAAEPLAPILSELEEKFSTKLKSSEQEWKKARELAAKFVALSVPIALRVAADIVPGGRAIGASIEKAAEKQFEHFTAAKKSIDALKKTLAKLTQSIREGAESPGETDGNARPPIVVLVDELDRCRPNYAIQLLEVLKHFFQTPGIIFVLAVDREQLISSAKGVFGSGLNADGYLRRFIDFECSLPEPRIMKFCYERAVHNAGAYNWSGFSSLLASVSRMCENARFSLRRTEQFLMRAGVAVAAGLQLAEPDEIIFLVFLREFDWQLYSGFVNGQIAAWDVLLRVRQVDADFGYPTDRDGLPFIRLLATVGQNDKPKPFWELFEEDYKAKNIKSNTLAWLRQASAGGNFRPHLRRIADVVDFCAMFK
jgi:hypothetical protein